MKVRRVILIVALALALTSTVAQGRSFEADIAALVDSSCIHCHDADTQNGMSFEELGYDLTDPVTFRIWEKVFDRVSAGEMPPESEERPNPLILEVALRALEKDLRATSLAIQKTRGRVPARRLTQLEYANTIRDLLMVDGNVAASIPAKTNASGFDTVGSNQRLSAVHVESYLKSADDAIREAINLNANPFRSSSFDIKNGNQVLYFADKPLQLGGGMYRVVDKGVAVFNDNDYLLGSYSFGFSVPASGKYRITYGVEAFQSGDKPVLFKVIKKDPNGGATLLGSFDLYPGDSDPIVLEVFFKPGDSFYPSFEVEGPSPFIGLAAGVDKYKGPGFLIQSCVVDGPLAESWPPSSTQQLLFGTELVSLKSNNSDDQPKSGFEVDLEKTSIEHIAHIVRVLAPRVLRRPASEGEIDTFIHLAVPAIEEGREFVDVLKVPLRSMLSSPGFLLFDNKVGQLDDFALANRLSYFLWRSMPDDELFALAGEGKLSYPSVLAMQVDRMLDDEKAGRLIQDFIGQWLQLYKVNATNPDEQLYPEYDELLGEAIMQESELFFAELVRENLSLCNVIDSDFTFVNRRLAKHYKMEGIDGQYFRRVELPADSPRGGMLTQAAILKTTANGTVTSPVMRGNFVLASILGTPPSPPPPNVGSIDPDTRGTTTIREQLAAHREIETCNKCHSKIDPPGFALESFDPIGGYRTKYRVHVEGIAVNPFFGGRAFKQGPDVDASGTTADGKKFSGIEEFKQLLLEQKDQIAKNFISQLVVFSTGGEIQFADRAEVKAILEKTREDNYPIRSMIHEVVQSQMFRNL